LAKALGESVREFKLLRLSSWLRLEPFRITILLVLIFHEKGFPTFVEVYNGFILVGGVKGKNPLRLGL